MTPRALARKNAFDTAAALLVRWKLVEKQQSLLFENAFRGLDIGYLESQIAVLATRIKILIDLFSEKRLNNIVVPVKPRRFPTSDSIFERQLNGIATPIDPKRFKESISILNKLLIEQQKQLIEMENKRAFLFKDCSRKLNAIKRKRDRVSLENGISKIYRNGAERTFHKAGIATFIEMLWNFINTDLNTLSLVFTVLSTKEERINAPPPLEYRPQISPNAPAL